MKRLTIMLLFFTNIAYADMGGVFIDELPAQAVATAGGCAAAGSAVAYRASANSTATTAANVTVNKPAGTVADDLMIAGIHYEKDASTMSPPAGWTFLGSSTTTATSPDANLYFYYKRAGGSEGASYVWTFASGYRQGVISTYQNVNTGCGPMEVSYSTATFSGLAWTAGAITTAFANSQLVIIQGNFDGNNSTEPLGWAERVDTSQMSVQDIVQASAGSSGTKIGAVGGSTNGNVIMGGMLD